MAIRSPVAYATLDVWGRMPGLAAFMIVSTGKASCGLGAGSTSFMLFSKCWNRRSSSLVPSRLRGSENPAKTWVWPT
eukprot:scaffold47429_cov47-Attheya_sp.AAC.1